MTSVTLSPEAASSSVCSTGGLNHAGSAPAGAAYRGGVEGDLRPTVGPRGRPFDEGDEHPRPDHHAADRDRIEVGDRSGGRGRGEEEALQQEPGHLRTAADRNVERPHPRVAAGRRKHVDRRGGEGGRRAEAPHLLVQRGHLLFEPRQGAGDVVPVGCSLTSEAPAGRPSRPSPPVPWRAPAHDAPRASPSAREPSSRASLPPLAAPRASRRASGGAPLRDRLRAARSSSGREPQTWARRAARMRASAAMPTSPAIQPKSLRTAAS